ncbi:hypothetical protein JOB18_015564, partial [Solea senegalensis]
MALAGCPDYFLRHPNYQESMDRTSSRRPDELIVPGFQHSANQNLPHHHDDDVDLEQLVNDMNSSMESVYSTQADTALLLNNGHMHTPHYHQQQHHHHAHAAYPGHGQQAHRRHTPPLHPSSPSREKLRHSQPMHIQAVRCLQEEQQQLRPASLPAIPNPFPELCSPAGSPVLSPIQTTDNHLHTIHLYTVVARLVMPTALLKAASRPVVVVFRFICVYNNDNHHMLQRINKHLSGFEVVNAVSRMLQTERRLPCQSREYIIYGWEPLPFLPRQSLRCCSKTQEPISRQRPKAPPTYLDSDNSAENTGLVRKRALTWVFFYRRHSVLYILSDEIDLEP